MSKIISSDPLSIPATSLLPVDLSFFAIDKHEKGIYLAVLFVNVFLDAVH